MVRTKNYYAVAKGRKIFQSWFQAEASVAGYQGSVHKGFETIHCRSQKVFGELWCLKATNV